jgi:CheY-like chemotaxis protein
VAESTRVLVVEDTEVTRQFMVDVLHLEGYDVRAVADGPSAQALVAAWRPDIAVVDLRLSDHMNGTQVAAWLRAAVPHIRIVLYSACRGAEVLAAVQHALGVDAFLAKPFDIEDLLRVIRR